MFEGKVGDIANLGLLQFVPNDEIANNYLKSSFYLRDATYYRESETRTQNDLKADETEGVSRNWSILENSFFISCYTFLDSDDFDDGGKIKDSVVENLERDNYNHGKLCPRPFITIKDANVNCLLTRLCWEIHSYIQCHNLKSSGFFFKPISYLSKDEYLAKEESIASQIIEYSGIIDKSNLKKMEVSKDKDGNLKSILQFLYLTKLNKYSPQKEYRAGVAFDDPLEVSELEIPVRDLSKYIRVHQAGEINDLSTEDL